MSQREDDAGANENFALYGFQMKVPETWRVEFNPKGTRKKGDVVFTSPKKNRIFVSWGPLENVSKRFKTIEEQRDWGLSALKKSRDVRSILVTGTRETLICGHKALITHVSASVRGGLMARRHPDRHLDSAYFYCPTKSRYYIVYSLLNTPDEYSDFSKLFDTMAQSLICH
jgi:hypothetical protein